MAALVALGVLAWGASAVGAPAPVSLVVALAFVVVLVTVSVRTAVFRVRDRRQLTGDVDQARRAREARPPVRRRPGAPLFRFARSSAEFAEWLDGVRRVPLPEVAAVHVTGVGRRDDPVVVTVGLIDGQTLVYRSPDRMLARLFEPWTPAPGQRAGRRS